MFDYLYVMRILCGYNLVIEMNNFVNDYLFEVVYNSCFICYLGDGEF